MYHSFRADYFHCYMWRDRVIRAVNTPTTNHTNAKKLFRVSDTELMALKHDTESAGLVRIALAYKNV